MKQKIFVKYINELINCIKVNEFHTIIKYILCICFILKGLILTINYKLKRGRVKYHQILNHYNIDATINHINRVYEDYIKYIPNSTDLFRDKRILEIGTGDNLGIALKFISQEAEFVLTIDKYYIIRERKKEQTLYDKLKRDLNKKQQKLIENTINFENEIQLNKKKLNYIYGVGVENLNFLNIDKAFDVIVSNAVLEHVDDLDKAFLEMDKILKPGGWMIHRIDLRDHEMFSGVKLHPLTFLTVPHLIYKIIRKNLNTPNRKLIDYYRNKMVEINYDYKILITSIIGMQEEFTPFRENLNSNEKKVKNSLKLLENFQNRLKMPFKMKNKHDLIISGIFLIAKKKLL
ncbi:MAG: class I SAM-dependent methyltransferase [Promethearchaeota archaeon]